MHSAPCISGMLGMWLRVSRTIWGNVSPQHPPSQQGCQSSLEESLFSYYCISHLVSSSSSFIPEPRPEPWRLLFCGSILFVLTGSCINLLCPQRSCVPKQNQVSTLSHIPGLCLPDSSSPLLFLLLEICVNSLPFPF